MMNEEYILYIVNWGRENMTMRKQWKQIEIASSTSRADSDFSTKKSTISNLSLYWCSFSSARCVCVCVCVLTTQLISSNNKTDWLIGSLTLIRVHILECQIFLFFFFISLYIRICQKMTYKQIND
jgi:hypothetical protein